VIDLADIGQRLLAGAELDPAERQLVSTVLAAVQRHAGQAHRRARRDALVRELAATHYPGLAISAQAARIARAAHRYAGCGWRHDRCKTQCPAHLAGRPEAVLWLLMKLAAEEEVRFPLKQRQIESILKSSNSTRTQNKALEIA
jgi:hypothetical protein